MSNFLKNCKIRNIKASQSTGTSTVTSSTIDNQGFDGFCVVASIATPNAANYLKLQDSDDDSTYADVAGSKVIGDGSTDKNLLLDVYRPQKRYNQVNIVRAGATTVTGDIWVIQYKGRYAPYAHATTGTIASVLVVSPADGTP